MSKPAINILIAKRGRNDYLSTCLFYLNNCNSNQLYDVKVYVIDDCQDVSCDFLRFSNIDIVYTLWPVSAHFNKGVLLNHGLATMRPTFDWLSIVDIDMIYHPDFFGYIYPYLALNGPEYVVCTGHGMDIDTTKRFMTERIPFDIANFPVYRGPSQVSMTHFTYSLILDIYGSLYSDDFVGWGGEDSELSFKTTDMKKAGLISKRTVPSMWLHMYHDSTKEQNLFERNWERFLQKVEDNKLILNEWVRGVNNERIHSNTNLQDARRDTTANR